MQCTSPATGFNNNKSIYYFDEFPTNLSTLVNKPLSPRKKAKEKKKRNQEKKRKERMSINTLSFLSLLGFPSKPPLPPFPPQLVPSRNLSLHHHNPLLPLLFLPSKFSFHPISIYLFIILVLRCF